MPRPSTAEATASLTLLISSHGVKWTVRGMGEPGKGRKAPKVEAKLSQRNDRVLGQITRLELMEEPSTASFGDIHNQVNHKRATCFLTKQLVVCCAVLLLTSRGRFDFAEWYLKLPRVRCHAFWSV
jgi:hypothetical protein